MDPARPLEAIDAKFQEIVQGGGSAASFNVPEEWLEQLDAVRHEIPSLHDVDRMYIRPNSLVRFRGMIQDTHNPEIYLDVYATRGPQGQTEIHTSRYRDTAQPQNDWEFDLDSPHNVYKSRHTLHCVPVPAENEWVRETLSATAATVTPNQQEQAARRSGAGQKRTAMDEDDDDNGDNDDDNDGDHDDAFDRIASGQDSAQRQANSRNTPAAKKKMDVADDGDLAAEQSPAISEHHRHNLPVPDSRTPALLKVYTEELGVKVHDLVEVIGVYVVDPTPPTSQSPEESAFHTPLPPSSVLPRIHCLHVRRMPHHNPLLPALLQPQDAAQTLQADTPGRPALSSALRQLTGGDELAADMLLLHLLSAVHTRTRDGAMTLGHLPLNVYGIDEGTQQLPTMLADFVSSIATSSHVVDMALPSMNASALNPRKNPATDRLEAGMLQLPAHTHVLVDETRMQEGQLGERGVKNLMALQTAVQSQQLAFEFEHAGPILFDIDVQLLILSEGRSLLPVLTKIPLRPTREIQAPQLPPAVLKVIRRFLDLAKHADYTIADEMQETISRDFSEMRQRDPRVTADALHRLLNLARLVSLSYGRTTLDQDAWEEAKRLDNEVQTRA